MIGGNNQLTGRALVLMLDRLSRLRWIGDLHDWSLTAKVLRRTLAQLEAKWAGRRTEPKRPQQQSAEELQTQHGVRMNTQRIVELSMNANTDWS